jgi:hypothetical protein
MGMSTILFGSVVIIVVAVAVVVLATGRKELHHRFQGNMAFVHSIY